VAAGGCWMDLIVALLVAGLAVVSLLWLAFLDKA